MPPEPKTSLLRAWLLARCPACGRGPLFRNVLELREACDKCGMSYRFIDTGDGPAVFAIFILGFLVLGLALYVEFTYEPPTWVHVVLWGGLTPLIALVLLRVLKAGLIALQYKHKAEEGRLARELMRVMPRTSRCALRARGLLWPAVMTLIGVVFLVALGNWQMRRLAWKEGLIAAIAERAHAAPISLADAEQRGGDVEYLRVKATGKLLNDRELDFYAFDEQAGVGWHIVTPLQLADGSIVFVNRGFVPDELKDQAKRQEGGPAGEVEIVGLARKPETPGAFTPAERRRQERLVLARYSSHGRGRCTRRQGPRRPLRRRRRARAASIRGMASGRRDPPRAAESASRVRADLVRPGCGASRRVRRVCRHALAPAARLSRKYPRNLRVLTHLCAGAPRGPSFACSGSPGPLGCS